MCVILNSLIVAQMGHNMEKQWSSLGITPSLCTDGLLYTHTYMLIRLFVCTHHVCTCACVLWSLSCHWEGSRPLWKLQSSKYSICRWADTQSCCQMMLNCASSVLFQYCISRWMINVTKLPMLLYSALGCSLLLTLFIVEFSIIILCCSKS